MNGKPKILIVDDDEGQRSLLGTFLERRHFRVETAPSADAALQRLTATPADLVVSDMRMPGLSGLEFMEEARRRQIRAPFILVTAYADVRDAVGAIRKGAVDYLEKPIDLDELLDFIHQALGLDTTEKAEQGEPMPQLPDHVVVRSRAMRRLLVETKLVAETDTRVLITGESGTGKEIVAQLLHGWSNRHAKPMITVNCAALPETLLESELFGHEKGAFTGADKERRGRFEEAHGSTLFLDEIGELPPHLQAKLLRVIQDGSFERLGANRTRHADVRVIAATNRDLEAEVAAGRFREDLFYRLNVIELFLPPLRDRTEDILALAERFAARFAKGRARFSGGVTNILSLYNWPGNVRELQNAMERAALLAAGGTIMPEHLPRRIREAVTQTAESTDETEGEGKMKQMERALILQTLAENDFNRTQTAQRLGISRRALIYKLREIEALGYETKDGG